MTPQQQTALTRYCLVAAETSAPWFFQMGPDHRHSEILTVNAGYE